MNQKNIIVSLLLILTVAGCSIGNQETVTESQCLRHDCQIGIKECRADAENFSEWSKGNKGYYEWYCGEDFDGCGRWMSDHEICNLTDLSVLTLGYGPKEIPKGVDSYQIKVGDLLILQAVIEDGGPIVPDNFDISYYVNMSPCTDIYDCGIIPSQDVKPEFTWMIELIERKTVQITDINPSYDQVYGSEGLHYNGNGMIIINSSYQIKNPGHYLFYVKVDEDNKIMEADEDNNKDVIWTPLLVYPDNWEADYEAYIKEKQQEYLETKNP